MANDLQLTRTQKVAFARILSDLIESDFIVEEREMDFFERSIKSNGITEKMLRDAKETTLAEAVSALKELDRDRRGAIGDCLKQLALSDGFCVPLEAVLIFAMELAIGGDASVYSVPTSDIVINNMTVIYAESGEKNSAAKAIESNYRTIGNSFAMAGFDFVYIPFVVEDYKKMSTDYLEKVVRYMIPSIAQDEISDICRNLQSMTTSKFCRDLLYKKVNVPLLDVGPSLLFKLNESSVTRPVKGEDTNRINYANYLRVDIKGNVVKEINGLVDAYRSMINSPITVNCGPATHKFRYYGFHRSLFDLIAFGKEQSEYRLVIDLSQRFRIHAYFESTDDRKAQIPVQLTPQRLVLYALIVKHSVGGDGDGLEWGEHVDAETEKSIVNEFNELYGKISGKTVHAYQDRSQVSHINKFIGQQTSIVNREQFMPQNMKVGSHSFYRISAPASKVQIIE